MTKKLEKSILPFIKGNKFCWPTDFQESGYCLYRVRHVTNKKELFQSGEFSEELETLTNHWDFITIVKSALWYHLDSLKNSRKASNRSPFCWLDWYTLIFVFLNKNTSKKEVLNIFEYLYEAPDSETLLGVKRAISTFTAFPFVPISPKSLNNLLIFLKIDTVSREVLVKEIFKKQNLEDLVNFLTTLESTVNTDLVLTDALSFYFETLENEAPSMKKITEQINDITNFTRLELETFNIFDIMDSSEQVKSGSSQLYVFSFNEALLLSLIKNPSNTPLKIFELFESHLYQTKQKTIFFIKISFEKGGDLYKLISDFCFTCEKEIKFYAKWEYMNSGLSLFSYVFRIIAASLGLLLFFASSRYISTRTARFDQIKSKTLGNVAYVTREEFGFEQVQTEIETTIISENVLTENNKMVRTREPSFGSIIPHFSKNPVKASQPVPITQSVALQAPTPVQVFQKFESTVRPTRSIPRSTTQGYGQVTREGLKGNYSMVGFQQSSIELRRVPFALRLPVSHASTMNAMIEKLEYTYPGVSVNVSQIYKKEGDVYLPTNQLSLFGTSLQYKDCTAIKKSFSSFVDSNNYSSRTNKELITLEFANPGQLEGDHTKNTVQRQMLKLLPGESGVVFMGKTEHDLIGDKRNFSMPDEIGYTPGTAGAMDFISFIEEDNASVIRVVFDQNNGETLSAKGYDADVVSRGYKEASDIDRKKVQEKIENSGVDGNIFLAVNVNNMFDDGIAENFNDFIDLVDEKGIDCKRACDDLNDITVKAAPRRQHAFSVGANLKEDTNAWRNFNKHEERVKDACKRAYVYVAGMTGYSETYIDNEAKEKFFNTTSKNPISLEEAFEFVTKDKSNLESLEKHPNALYGGRLYSKNHKRK